MKIKRNLIIIICLILISVLFCINNSYAIINPEFEEWSNKDKKSKENLIGTSPISVTLEETLGSNDTTTYPEKYEIEGLIARDQKNTNNCWAYSTTSMISSNMIKSKLTSAFTLFSTKHMDYKTSNKAFTDIEENPDGYKRELDSGANSHIGLRYVTAGYGPILETDMPDNGEPATKIPSTQMPKTKPTYKVDDFLELVNIYKSKNGTTITYKDGNDKEIDNNNLTELRNNIKKCIKEYGGVTVGIKINQNEYFNTDKSAYYCNDYSNIYGSNHNVLIVGWDDEYDKSNFKDTPVHNGAYKVLNSWKDTEYFYVSYDDPLIEKGLTAVQKTSRIDYDNLYQHDPLGYNWAVKIKESTSNSQLIANVFSTNKKDGKTEELTNVSLYVPEKSKVKILVNSENDDKTKQIQISETTDYLEPGYHTISLNKTVKLTGDKFVIFASLENDGNDGVQMPLEYNYNSNDSNQSNQWDTATSEQGQSYYYSENKGWRDIESQFKDTNICLKAFTKYVTDENTSTNTNENTTGGNTSTNTNENTTGGNTSTNTNQNTTEGNTSTNTSANNNSSSTNGNYYGDDVSLKPVKTTAGNSSSSNSADSTTATKSIPKAGTTLKIVILIAVVLVIGVYAFIKSRKLKDVK